jgi:5-methylcytosine-specific restriction endonuclease McrA
MVDVAGLRFGRLVVTGLAPDAKNGRVAWLCACDCGRQVTRSSKNLLNGTATSCGCRKREAGMANVRAREVDLSGSRFGKLVVAGEAGRPKPGVKLYRCVCDCGCERISRHGDLTNGRVISCGCAERGPHVEEPLTSDRAREICAASGANRRARKIAAGGRYTADQVADLLKKQSSKCANCGCELTGRNMARDHRVPLANGGSNDISNIELLCRPCNSRKHAKDPIAWARENGRLI